MFYSKLIFLILVSFFLVSRALNNNINNNNKSKKNLKPKKLSPKYDENTMALDFNVTCLGDTDAEEILLSLLNIYTCIQATNIYNNKAVHKHGNINRVYLSSVKNRNNGLSCLETNEIEWNDYCIEDISYDILFDLHGTCTDQTTNNIYYDTTKKANAWHLDLSEGVIDNKYKYPVIGNDDHKVDIWILDSGVYANHKEFVYGQIIDEDVLFTYSSSHGTGTAANAGGLNYGSSKRFKIHDYPVCRSTTCAFQYIDRGLQKAINWMKTTGRRAVINMSLGSSGVITTSSTAIYFEYLFQSVLNAGGIIVVSAGNDGADACGYWFSYSDKVISVGATDINKARASFSNYGQCVDIYAPGSQVPTAYSTTNSNYVAYVSGTSFSGPIVTGMVANILYENNTRTKDNILQILRQNVYPVSNCPSGYCYGTYYKCLY